ncbi:MAG: hypothetical protein ACRDXE_07455 [Acidimicrobiales bacterium]
MGAEREVKLPAGSVRAGVPILGRPAQVLKAEPTEPVRPGAIVMVPMEQFGDGEPDSRAIALAIQAVTNACGHGAFAFVVQPADAPPLQVFNHDDPIHMQAASFAAKVQLIRARAAITAMVAGFKGCVTDSDGLCVSEAHPKMAESGRCAVEAGRRWVEEAEAALTELTEAERGEA